MATKIVEKKLGRHKAVGVYFEGDSHVTVDPRLKERHRLEITIHEWLHRHDIASAECHSRMEDGDLAAGRAIEEADVEKHCADLAAMLWKAGYRRVRM
jgi:hypothetical protein